MTVQGGEIQYQNVNFSYTQNEPVLNDISFLIEQGKTAAFVGPSGGGKTTICSLLPRFYDINNGNITIDGNNIKDFKLKSLRNNIGVVQQDVYIFNGTIKDNISYGNPNADDAEIIEAAKKANIHDFITSLPDGYDTKVGERGARLSGGQKQRISIARVFLKNPRILILDEATSALDNESEKHIQEALDQLAKNRTTIVIAHRLSTIRNADIIYVIAEGKIKEKGNHKELMAQNGLYSRYYNMQFEGIDEL
jgi:ATP-binding cassette subfamily B protein